MVRFKNRYLLCAIDTEYGGDREMLTIQSRELLSAVRASLATNFGDLAVGQSMASLAVKLWSPALNLCILRCSRDYFRTAWAATCLITELISSPQLGRVRFSVIHVGGTIRSCQKSAAQHARTIIFEKRAVHKDAGKTESAASSMMNEMYAMET